MPFRYRLQKVLDFRIRKKEEQLQEVIKAKNEVERIQGLIDANDKEINGVIYTMRHNPDYRLMDSYDKYLKHLYGRAEQLQEEKTQAEEQVRIEEEKLVEKEKEVKVLEKHKEKLKEEYNEEMKKIEIKELSEIGVQKHFQRLRERKQEEGDD